MAEAIGKAIQAADRGSAEYYQTHTEEYTEKLRALDSELTKTVKEAKRDLLILRTVFRSYTWRVTMGWSIMLPTRAVPPRRSERGHSSGHYRRSKTKRCAGYLLY